MHSASTGWRLLYIAGRVPQARAPPSGRCSCTCRLPQPLAGRSLPGRHQPQPRAALRSSASRLRRGEAPGRRAVSAHSPQNCHQGRRRTFSAAARLQQRSPGSSCRQCRAHAEGHERQQRSEGKGAGGGPPTRVAVCATHRGVRGRGAGAHPSGLPARASALPAAALLPGAACSSAARGTRLLLTSSQREKARSRTHSPTLPAEG